jgi:hypothetical protein
MRFACIAGTCATLMTTAMACGSSPGGSPGGQVTANATTITQYENLSSDVGAAMLSYGAAMNGPGMTLAGCAAAHDGYDAQVRHMVQQMIDMSGAMDAFMSSHGGYGSADMGCVANAMLAEIDAHGRIACSYATLAEDQAEAGRHVGAMTSLASHAYDRCGSMMGGLGGSGYTWGPSAPGCTGGGVPGGSTDPVALGQRIFESGIGVDGQPIARTGGTMMMMGGCASCHGSNGQGLRMAMFTSPNVTYANLTDPSGMVEPDGSRGPIYTDDLVRRAVVTGVDADGQALSTVMPHWQLADQDWADLLMYLKTLP